MNDIAMEGLKMSHRLKVEPPKSLHSFLRQVEQFTVYAANSTLGATGLADLLIVVAGYVQAIRKTGYDHHIKVFDVNYDEWETLESAIEVYVKEQLTSLIYTLNWEFRGNQSPFTNVSVYDRYFLEQLLPSYVILGEQVRMGDVQLVQELFLDCMNETLARTAVTFPVVTACFSINEEKGEERKAQDTEFMDMIAEANLQFGFINIYMGKSSTLSSCCRLRSEAEGLGYANSFGSGSTKIGSMGVVTLNLPRMANIAILDSEDNDEVFENFRKALIGGVYLVQSINNAKREFLKDRISRGALPLYDLGYMSINKQYSTCGITGLYEALDFMGYDITTQEGLDKAEEILKTIQQANDFCKAKYGSPHNMEQVPAESSAVKLAEKDRIIGFIDEEDGIDFYSNQFIPLTHPEVDVLTRMEIQGVLDQYCDGGSILHINTKQRITKAEMMKKLIELACSKGVVYFAVNYAIHECAKGHVWAGAETCPVCGGNATETYTRVVGFLTNTKHWNKQRREKDFPNRHFY
jgi:ribonucleoside-triphosphate reductase